MMLLYNKSNSFITKAVVAAVLLSLRPLMAGSVTIPVNVGLSIGANLSVTVERSSVFGRVASKVLVTFAGTIGGSNAVVEIDTLGATTVAATGSGMLSGWM